MATREVMVDTDENGRVIGRSWKCDCGHKVESYLGCDVDCDRCDQAYNSFGQKLAPRNQWEDY